MSALPKIARMPLCSSTAAIASVWRTVPMSLMQVTPPAISSSSPSRAAAAIETSVCAASSGQTLSRSQRSRSLCSARPRKRVWQRCRCPWTRPGRTKAPEASTDSSARPPGSAASAAGTPSPSATMTPSRTSRSPRATVPDASMQTSVPEWKRQLLRRAPPCDELGLRHPCRSGPKEPARRGAPVVGAPGPARSTFRTFRT